MQDEGIRSDAFFGRGPDMEALGGFRHPIVGGDEKLSLGLAFHDEQAV